MRRALYAVALISPELVLVGALVALGLGYVVGTYAEGLRHPTTDHLLTCLLLALTILAALQLML